MDVEEVKELVQELPGLISKSVEEVLERKGVSAGNCTREMLDNAISGAFQRFRDMYHAELPAANPPPQEPETNDGEHATMFLWETDNKYHRLPENYILTARATADRGAITRTPREAYFR